MAKEKKILLVDDEHDYRQLMTFWLESKGYGVITAPDGETAINLVKKKEIDIVLMDVRMPGMDGVDAIKKIREFNEYIPIIVISAHVDDPKAKEAVEYGISGIFLKSKDFQEGLSLLESALRTHKKLKK